MSTDWLRALARKAWFLVRRDRAAAELEEEMRLHLELREARLRDQGAAPLEAYYAARRRFGNRTNLQQRSRDMWGLNWLDDAAADLRFAARRLRRRPGFAVSTILVAALGIGATTAVFSAIDAAFIRPLPFARPNELVSLSSVGIPMGAQFTPSSGQSGSLRQAVHVLEFTDARDMHDLFAGVGAYAAGGLNLSDASNPQRVRVGVVTPSFFSLLGAGLEAGRAFSDDEGRPDGPHAVVLSDAFWRDKMGGANLLGKTLELSGTRYTVVGIMKPGFSFPNESELWIPMPVPLTFDVFAPFRGYLPSFTIARLAPGVSVTDANARLLARWQGYAGSVGPQIASAFETRLKNLRANGAVIPLRNILVGRTQTAFTILMGAAALLLLTACTNVANLLLSDAAGRGREIALREVLGATPGRVARQLLVESSLLAVAGAALGLALAPAALRVLRTMMPQNLAGIAPAELDLRVLAFAAVIALVTGLVFGLWPALGTSKTDPGETIKSGGGTATASGLGRARRALITAELALTVMLLVGSGLMLKSLERVLTQNTGMNPEHVGTLEYATVGERRSTSLPALQETLERLAADPGIGAVGAVNDLPLRGGAGGIALSIGVDGAPAAKSTDEQVFARYLIASGGYFGAMGIPLLRGRVFTPNDDSLAPPVAVISESMAKQYWPTSDALGKTFHLMGADPITVVGIVADVREQSLESTPDPQMYFSIYHDGMQNVAIVARSTLPGSSLLARMRDAVHAANPHQAVYNVRTMDDVISTAVAPRRTNTLLIAIFGAIALALGAFGVYAVVSYGVTRRAREFGIRAALGASGRDIASLVGREMAWVVLTGLIVGFGGAWALSKILASLLYGVDVHDATTFAAAPLVLLVPAAIATFIPARRAARVNPTDVMRAD